jgi:hypothetical protein
VSSSHLQGFARQRSGLLIMPASGPWAYDPPELRVPVGVGVMDSVKEYTPSPVIRMTQASALMY